VNPGFSPPGSGRRTTFAGMTGAGPGLPATTGGGGLSTAVDAAGRAGAAAEGAIAGPPASGASATAKSTGISAPVASRASIAILMPKRSFTHCRTNRFGAVSRNRPARSAQASGRIQVAYCWGVSSRSKAARQAAQAAGVGVGCKEEGAFCDAISRLPERPLRAPGKVTGSGGLAPV
jgi:hypothetical protein